MFSLVPAKVEEGTSSSSQVTPVLGGGQPAADVKPKATPPSSPLLSSLLQNKHELQVSGLSMEGNVYTPYVGLNQKSRKLGVFGRKFEGSRFLFYCYFDKY